MSSYTEHTTGGIAVPVSRVAISGAVIGAVGGMAMAMIEMIYGWLSSAHTAWDAPMAITSWVFGTQYFGADAGAHIGSIAVGMVGHMMNAMILGAVFAIIAARYLRGASALALTMMGMAYGLAAYAVVLQGVVRIRGGAEQALLTGSAVSPQWVWIISHLAFGMVLGLGTAAVLHRRSA